MLGHVLAAATLRRLSCANAPGVCISAAGEKEKEEAACRGGPGHCQLRWRTQEEKEEEKTARQVWSAAGECMKQRHFSSTAAAGNTQQALW